MKYQIHDVMDIRNVNPDEPYIIVGIVDPDDCHPPYMKNDKCLGILRLHFYDSEFDDGINQDQARSIAKFVKDSMGGVIKPEIIIAHCIVGVSRSAGTIAAIMKCLNDNPADVFTNPRYWPSDRVYNYIVKAWEKMSIGKI